MSNKTTVTAAEVRAYFTADPKRMARLSPEAQEAMAEGRRGRLPREAVEVHNKSRRTRQYVSGATGQAKAQAKAEAAAQREALREAGFEVGNRGRLSAEAKEFLAQSKG